MVIDHIIFRLLYEAVPFTNPAIVVVSSFFGMDVSHSLILYRYGIQIMLI